MKHNGTTDQQWAAQVAAGKVYGGEKPLPVRPGSLDFLQCPHLIGGVRVPRIRPALISMRGEK